MDFYDYNACVFHNNEILNKYNERTPTDILTGAVDYGGCDYGGFYGGCDYGECEYGGCDYGECEYGGCDYGECDYGGCVSVRVWPKG